MKVATTNHPQQILRRIKAKGSGWAFTPHDFADLGDPRSIGMALTRLMRSDTIRRIGHGLTTHRTATLFLEKWVLARTPSSMPSAESGI